MKRVVVAGLGLMGGSIGKALRRSLPELEIVGVDREAIVLSGQGSQFLTKAVIIESVSDVSPLAQDADLVVLAMPVGEIAKRVGEWLRAGVPVTDCGSTKCVIVEAAGASPNRDWFLPGHPMAGRERGGLSASSPDLFVGRRWIVCPQSTRRETVSTTQELVEVLGAIWTEMTPSEHDASVALTSHLPQILASWLAASAEDHTWAAAGPAFADMTRVAGGSEAIWRDIFQTNSAAIAEFVGAAAADLASISAELQSIPPKLDLVLELLERARNHTAKASNR